MGRPASHTLYIRYLSDEVMQHFERICAMYIRKECGLLHALSKKYHLNIDPVYSGGLTTQIRKHREAVGEFLEHFKSGDPEETISPLALVAPALILWQVSQQKDS